MSALEAALESARRGQRLGRTQALLLYLDAPLAALGEAAGARRIARVDPRRVTYLVDRNINYTNVCITDCTFCAFYRPPGHPQAYVLSREQIGRKVEELIAIGGTRILLQGGHNPALGLAWYEELFRWLRAAYRSIEIDALSPSEVAHMAQLEGMSVREVLVRLEAAGLQGLPGGGGENLEPEVRMAVSPLKQSGFAWIETMRIAQELGLVTTASQVIGFGEPIEARVDHLLRLRRLQDESLRAHGNGFTAFISWPMQFENTGLKKIRSRREQESIPSPAEDYLRHLAMARLTLDNFEHFQASWPTMGPETAATALAYGADDYGSTMLEENVVSKAGARYQCLEEVTIQDRIRSAGYRPAKRDSRYRIVAQYD